jgi:hypothetical protein
MIKLRGHHLICLHFFEGEGYSKKFISNLKGIIKNLENDTKTKIVDGADAVCAYCPHLKTNICIYKPGYEKEIEALDKMALKLLNLKKGDALLWRKIKSKISKILPKWQEFACFSCDWRKVCFTKL